MTVNNKQEAFKVAAEYFENPLNRDAVKSTKAGYDIYTAADNNGWVSDLNDRLEINKTDGNTVNIWYNAEQENDGSTENNLAKFNQRGPAYITEFRNKDRYTVDPKLTSIKYKSGKELSKIAAVIAENNTFEKVTNHGDFSACTTYENTVLGICYFIHDNAGVITEIIELRY